MTTPFEPPRDIWEVNRTLHVNEPLDGDRDPRWVDTEPARGEYSLNRLCRTLGVDRSRREMTAPDDGYYLFCGHRGSGKSTELRRIAHELHDDDRRVKPSPMSESSAWPIRSEHSGTLLQLRRLVANRRSFTLCFLPYSDSAYRDIAAAFLAELLGARLHVAIDRDNRIGTEDLFERLSDQAHDGPVQLSGLERWPDGLDNLLQRLNYRREALAARCRRPLLAWIRNRDVAAVATGAADLWAWRSGVFDFTLPASADHVDPLPRRIDLPSSANESARSERLDELQRFLRSRSPLRPVDVDLLLELGDLQRSIGQPEDAERSYARALTALASMDDRRRRATARGRIADLLEARGELDEALRIRTEEQLPVFERLGDVRLAAIAKGQIADILQVRGDLDEALRVRTEEQLPALERLGDVRSVAITKGRIAGILQARGELDEALRIRTDEEIPSTSAWETSSRWPRPRRRSRNFGRRSHERHHRREASGTSRQRLALCRLSPVRPVAYTRSRSGEVERWQRGTRHSPGSA